MGLGIAIHCRDCTLKMFTRAAVVALITISLTGCGTILSRGEHSVNPGDFYFMSTQASAKMLTFSLPGYDAYTSMFCWVSVVCPFATVVLMPADLVIDTVMLPYDHYQYTH
ncbi:lipoprotein [compost metagenome]